jgi:hypothetical protein
MQLAAGRSGARLVTTPFSNSGLGVDSSQVAGATDSSANVFEILGGSSTGLGEFVQFSFDRPGLLTGFDFDGVKDELLEYFRLESANGLRISFVDSHADMPDAPHPAYEHPVAAAVHAGALSGEVVYLWEVSGLYDDEVYGLQLPFVAGQVFTLTFGYVGEPFSQGIANGARLQGIEVQSVPEPAAVLLVLAGGLVLVNRRRRTT